MGMILDNLLGMLNRMGESASKIVPPKSDVARLAIRTGITEIPAGALKGRKNLKVVSIPSTVRVIGESAFEDCTHLE